MVFGIEVIDKILNFVGIILKFILTLPDKLFEIVGLPTIASGILIGILAFVLAFWIGKKYEAKPKLIWIIGGILFLLFHFLRA